MVYTLAQGARGYDNRLHYSLYGGVESLPDRVLPLQEILATAAIPAAAIALFAGIMSFYGPNIHSGSSGGGSTAAPGKGSVTLELTSGSPTSSSLTAPAAPAGTAPANAQPEPVAASTATIAAPSGMTPLGSDNGQGIIGGMGSGTTTTTGSLPSTDPVPSPLPEGGDTGSTSASTGSGGTTATADTPLVQASASVSTQQASVNASVPAIGTSVSLDPAL